MIRVAETNYAFEVATKRKNLNVLQSQNSARELRVARDPALHVSANRKRPVADMLGYGRKHPCRITFSTPLRRRSRRGRRIPTMAVQQLDIGFVLLCSAVRFREHDYIICAGDNLVLERFAQVRYVG